MNSTELFAGAAAYYGQYRPRYPAILMTDLIVRARPSGGGCLLDIGCGTGEVALRLHPHFSSVVAVDQQAELIEVGRRNAASLGATNVRWEVTSAETYAPARSSFELVTIGNSFHHFDRFSLARRIHQWLRPGGSLAILGSSSVLAGTEGWKSDLFDVVRTFQPSITRPTAEEGWAGAVASHSEVVTRAGFDDVCRSNYQVEHCYAIDELIGYLHSTWFASPGALSLQMAEFDAAVREAMTKYQGGEGLREVIIFHCVIGRRRRLAADGAPSAPH